MTSKPAEEKKKDELPFEEALTRLEALVGELEGGRVSLDESMKKFSEGMQLANQCSKKLAEAEKKIEILVKQPTGADAEWAPFKTDSGDDAR
jgi:exodeoxyribonuclease VII small subunit